MLVVVELVDIVAEVAHKVVEGLVVAVVAGQELVDIVAEEENRPVGDQELVDIVVGEAHRVVGGRELVDIVAEVAHKAVAGLVVAVVSGKDFRRTARNWVASFQRLSS